MKSRKPGTYSKQSANMYLFSHTYDLRKQRKLNFYSASYYGDFKCLCSFYYCHILHNYFKRINNFSSQEDHLVSAL